MLYQDNHFGISEYFCKETGENFSFPMHMHHSFELITVLEGDMEVSIENCRYELKKGEGVLVFPEQIHSLKSTASKHLLVIFSPDTVSTYYSSHLTEIPKNSKIAIPPYLMDPLQGLDAGSSVVRRKAILYSMCAMLEEDAEYLKKKNDDYGLLYSIFDFVEKNYANECSLHAMSLALGYNSAYVSHYFKEITAMSFVGYLNRCRISKACYSLRNTNKSILECAYESGYSSLRSFNRNFKSIIGSTPKEYRNKQ